MTVRGGKKLSELSVLVLDGDTGYRRLMVSELRNLGVSSVKSADKPEDALEILTSHQIDVMVTEFYIPFIKFVRASKKTAVRTLPIILVTNRMVKEDVLAARDAGINTFVAKPVSASALCEQILRAVNDARPIVASEDFTGPDRRRRGDGTFNGPDRRESRSK